MAAWADEVKKYTFHPPSGFTEATGHFTQLVWNSTTEVGCAAVDCGYDQTVAVVAGEKRAKGWYVVCEYRPAGNVVGRDNALFKSNVFPRVAEESLTSALHSRSGHASGTGMATGNPGERKVSSGAAAGRGRAGILGVVAFVLLWL